MSDYSNGNPAPTHGATLDLTFSNFITSHIELLRYVQTQWEELAGISKQRKGQTMASESATGVNSSLQQSYVATEIYNSLFEEFKETEYSGLLDISKIAWAEGKKFRTILPDNAMGFIELDGSQHMETNYGIFVNSGSLEKAKLDKLKELTQPLLQNGAKPHVIAEILDADNLTVLKERIKQADIAADELQSAIEQNKNAQAEANNKALMETTQMQIESNEKIASDKNKTAIYVAEIGNYFKVPDLDSDNDGTPDALEIGKLALEGKRLDIDTRLKKEELDIKREKNSIDRIKANKTSSK